VAGAAPAKARETARAPALPAEEEVLVFVFVLCVCFWPVLVDTLSRGGERMRRMKQKYGLSEMHKQAIKMKFGEEERDLDQNSLGKGMGVLSQGGTGGGWNTVKVKIKEKNTKSMECLFLLPFLLVDLFLLFYS
jgi:hypothetical protein